MEIESLSSYCSTPNIAGLVTIQYAPLPWLAVPFWEPIRSAEGNHQNQVVFQATRDWLTVQLLPDGREWQEGSERNLQGQAYQQRIAGRTPAMRPAVTAEFARMENVGFVLRLVDRNRRAWLIGDPDHLLYFTAQATTGDGTGNNRYDISWEGVTRWRAAGYVPIV